MKEFKLIVAGSRDFTDYQLLQDTVIHLANHEYRHMAVSLVSGMARGADALAVRLARDYGIQLYEFPADWDAYGKRAGFVRNAQMAQFSHGLVAFWDGVSRGTKNMIETMMKQDKPVHVVHY